MLTVGVLIGSILSGGQLLKVHYLPPYSLAMHGQPMASDAAAAPSMITTLPPALVTAIDLGAVPLIVSALSTCHPANAHLKPQHPIASL